MFNIKNSDLHKNNKRCLQLILAIIRTDKDTGRAKIEQISIKINLGAKDLEPGATR
jgi:hypothetical protein